MLSVRSGSIYSPSQFPLQSEVLLIIELRRRCRYHNRSAVRAKSLAISLQIIQNGYIDRANGTWTNSERTKAKKYCSHHKVSSHNTDECFALKQHHRQQADEVTICTTYDTFSFDGVSSIVQDPPSSKPEIFLGSGCTQTYVRDRSLSSTYEPYNDNIFIVSGAPMKAIGKGRTRLLSRPATRDKEDYSLLTDVLHVPGMSPTISVSHGLICQVDGITFSGDKDLIVIRQDEDVILTASVYSHNLWTLDVTVLCPNLMKK